MRWGKRPLLLVGALTLTTILPVAAGARAEGDGGWAGHAALVARLHEWGYLVGDRARFNALKSVAPPASSSGNGTHETRATAGSTSPSWQGLDESSYNAPFPGDDLSPSDSTGAIGPTSYLEIINIQLGIYSRQGALLSSSGLEALTGTTHLDLSDPQILWDGQTQRFYYLALDVTDDTLRWGFSKSATPKTVSSNDWCSYTADYGYGSDLPDYPKLGQSSSYLIIGANIYDGATATYVGSDLDTITKPPAGKLTSCPGPGGFLLDRHAGLRNFDGSRWASDPNPAQQAGWSPVGWVAAVPDSSNSGATGNYLDVFRVVAGVQGHSQVSTAGKVDVAAYAPPTSAPQSGAPIPLDTLDGRLTQAVAAVDPTLAGSDQWALWTSHTVAGGAGAALRWYEIQVHAGAAPATLVQQGTVQDASLYVFNGAVSDDRRATGATSGSYGADAVIGVTTSSAATEPTVQMVAKVHGMPQTGLQSVHASSGPDNGFDCTEDAILSSSTVCRWGDYSGASPDPAAPVGDPVGRVWLTNMAAAYSTPVPNLVGGEWTTWDWEARP